MPGLNFRPLMGEAERVLMPEFRAAPKTLFRRELKQDTRAGIKDVVYDEQGNAVPQQPGVPVQRPTPPVQKLSSYIINKLAASEEELAEAAKDISTHARIYGTESASQIPDDPYLQEKIREWDPVTKRQVLAAILGTTGGAVTGAGLGALTGGLAKGKKGAILGAVGSSLPGALSGGIYGYRRQRRNDLQKLLSEQS